MTLGYMTQIDEQQVNGVLIRTHRFVEKRPVARGIPTADPAVIHYITEQTDVHQLEIVLDNGAVLLEPGALQYMHGKIASDVVQHEAGKGFLARAVASAGTGESAHATKYTGKGSIWCEPTRKHFIVGTMDNESDAMMLDDKAFYACSEGIKLSTVRHNSVSGVLSGNGLMQPKIAGKGIFAVESPVPLEELKIVELQHGEELVVDGDFMLMYSASLNVSIGPLVRGLRNIMRSGEGLVYRLQGQGTVYLTPTSRIA